MTMFPIIATHRYKFMQQWDLVIFGVTIVYMSFTLQGCAHVAEEPMVSMMTFDNLDEGWCGFNNTIFPVCREFSRDTKEECENECRVRPECGAFTYSDQTPEKNCHIHGDYKTEFKKTEAVSNPVDTISHKCYRKDSEAFEKD